MVKGTVDFFNDTGGYGFIETDAHDEEVFFHMEDISGPDLEEGQTVWFDIQSSPKGPRTKDLRRAPSQETAAGETSGDTDVFESSGGETGAAGGSEGDETSPEEDTQVFESNGSTGKEGDVSTPSFCPNCGTDLSRWADASFCPECGLDFQSQP